MSYDIRFGVRVYGGNEDTYAVVGQPEYDSPTYNLGTMFRKCMDWDYTQGVWYPVAEVLPKVERGLNELKLNPKKYKQYEPDNGWGTIGSAIKCLQSVVGWIKDPFQMGWNEDIPLECFYMRW